MVLLLSMAWPLPGDAETPMLASPAGAVTRTDPPGDATVRRTDSGADAPVDPAAHRLPDVVSYTIGGWQPLMPQLDLFTGQWSNSGQFFRLDIVFIGLMNPPGTVGCCGTSYAPFQYGPHPLFGTVEIDMDANVNTGGELDYPQLLYLGNVARFGGLPKETRFNNRTAIDASAFDHTLSTPPFVDRSGEDWRLAFEGWQITGIQRSDNLDMIFGPGETWILTGRFFQRCHGYSRFSWACCQGDPGSYEPLVKLRFAHAVAADQTTVSFVYPRTNAGSAASRGEPTVEDPDGDVSNQNSVLEGLDDLVFSTHFPEPGWPNDPNYPIIAPWLSSDLYPSPNDVSRFLNPPQWEITLLLGSGYVVQPGDALFFLSELWPNVIPGDFNGDGKVDFVDLAFFNNYISSRDGQSGQDGDGTVNGVVVIINFGPNFSLFDLNYDGRVDAADRALIQIFSAADFDRDRDVDLSDWGHLQLCLTGSEIITPGSECDDADLNDDTHVNGEDVIIFRMCASRSTVTADPACGWQ